MDWRYDFEITRSRARVKAARGASRARVARRETRDATRCSPRRSTPRRPVRLARPVRRRNSGVERRLVPRTPQPRRARDAATR